MEVWLTASIAYFKELKWRLPQVEYREAFLTIFLARIERISVFADIYCIVLRFSASGGEYDVGGSMRVVIFFQV